MKALLVSLVLIVAAAACGNDTTTAGPPDYPVVDPPQPSPSAEIMAAAAHQLVTVDHTFGSGPSPFTTFLVQDHTDPSAGTGDYSGGDTRALTPAEQEAIGARLSPLGTVTWIEDPADHRTDDLVPTVEGGVIIGLGEPSIDDGDARVPVSLWCGGLCGTWLTYTVELADGAWQVTGIDGPVTIS